MTKPLNWPNILLHCAVALLMAAGAGAGLHIGLAYAGLPGLLLAACGALGGLSVALYWPLRERLQHNREWGGKQSMAEWIGPVVATPFGMAAGWWASKLLL